jgi:hypothetical protein
VLGLFEFFSDDHTAENLYQFYLNVFAEYGILDKIIAGTTDNGANYAASIRRDEKSEDTGPSQQWAPIRCFIHTLQLAVRDALKVISFFSFFYFSAVNR